MKKRIVAFGAHQDDIEIRSGGTIAKYIKDGYEVIYVVAVDSVYVNPGYAPQNGKTYDTLTHKDILDIRKEESAKGAKTLGVSEPVFFHLKPSYYWKANASSKTVVNFTNTPEDNEAIEEMKSLRGEYFCLQAARTPECIKKVCDFLETIEPEIVLTQQPNDLHLEHYSVAALVFTACQSLAKEGKFIKLYAWEMGSSGKMLRFVPDVIVDISNHMDKKIEAVRHFVSQVNNSDTHINFIKKSARFWGDKIGVKYAEPFSEFMVNQTTDGFDLATSDFEKTTGLLPEFKCGI
jgi:LmbE family N-acetylglucosaminyl deacetylase